jgi:hypothetical protein
MVISSEKQIPQGLHEKKYSIYFLNSAMDISSRMVKYNVSCIFVKALGQVKEILETNGFGQDSNPQLPDHGTIV